MTERRDAQPQPHGASGKAPCPRCGAPNFATDATCLSCGTDLDAIRAHPAPSRAEPKREMPPARERPAISLPDLPLSALSLRGWSVTRTESGMVRMAPRAGGRLRLRGDQLAAGLWLLLLGGFLCFAPPEWVTRSRSGGAPMPLWPPRAFGAFLLFRAGRELASFCVREEWEVGPDRLEVRQALFRRPREACYTQARLEVRKRVGNYRRSSFWETSFDLFVFDGSGQTAILASATLFRWDVCALGRFLAEVTGWPLTEPRWL